MVEGPQNAQTNRIRSFGSRVHEGAVKGYTKMTTLKKIRDAVWKARELDCEQAQETMSAFIDSMTSQEEAQELEVHVAGCPTCRRQLQGYISLRNFVARVPAPALPADLALEARIRLSHARTDDLRTRLNAQVANVLKPHVLPAAAGVLATCFCFAFLLGSFQASPSRPENDVSLLWIQTQPRAADPLMLQLAALGLDDVTVDVAIDKKGKAFSTVILNGPDDPLVDQWLKDVLMLGEFRPATIYGRPVPSRLVLSFVGVQSSPLA